MGKKLMNWKVKGMNRDVSVSAFNPEFAFENMNLRLSTNEHNTLMSWVNEKGTKELHVSIDTKPWLDKGESTVGRYKDTIEGDVLGTAVLNHQLVLFTHGIAENDSVFDCIYVLWFDEDEETEEKILRGNRLYQGILDFYPEYPLETLVSYEAEHIQKVYWTDGLNQPRVINIAATKEKLEKWNHAGDPVLETDTWFDFVPSLSLMESLTVEQQMAGDGTFAPGVIQYCFSYINKYGQQSNIVEVSPLYYLTHTDRGASPEDKVTCSFTIEVTDPDPNFDYVRLYSIQRTSLNTEPIVKLLEDIAIEGVDNTTVTYIDNGTTGSMMDPTELLFIGGKEIKALTMADKDGTLFLGNITQEHDSLNALQKHFRDNKPTISFQTGDPKTLSLDHTDGIYSHTNTLKHNQRKITTFKGGEQYRFGFQLQKETGEWSEPIWIGDETNNIYPQVNTANWDSVGLVYATASITLPSGTDITKYKKIRPVIVHPNINDRKVLCQGVLNPTVFNALDRIDNSPYAQASWFFRPIYNVGEGSEDWNIEIPTDIDLSSLVRVTSDSDLSLYHDVYGPVSQEAWADLFQTVYVLVADMGDTVAANYIPPRGYIKTVVSQDNSSHEEKHEFLGIIDLTGTSQTKRYAFLKTSPWPEEVSGLNGVSVKYTEEIKVLSNNNYPFKIYNDLHVAKGFLFLYYKVVAGNNIVTSMPFNFYTTSIREGYDSMFYSVTFKAYNSGTTRPVITNNKSGTSLEYRHLHSLPTDEEFQNGDDRKDLVRCVEIQGSRKSFEDAFGTAVTTLSDEQASSNTQFFIDQSIVTLHSPDLEFDTEVQSWGTEGLHLRIVGAIPITASVSSHDISISSNMLEMDSSGVTREEVWSTMKEEGLTLTEAMRQVRQTHADTHHYGSGELNYNITHKNTDIYAGKRLVADYLWQDIALFKDADSEDKVKSSSTLYKYLVYPWHRSGSMNNDWRSNSVASSVLKTKKEGSLLYSVNTKYLDENSVYDYGNDGQVSDISSQIVLTENAQVMNYRLPKQEDDTSEINYYPNIDKVLYNKKGYLPVSDIGIQETSLVYNPVSMRYKSTTHAVVAIKALSGSNVRTLPNCSEAKDKASVFWGDQLGVVSPTINRDYFFPNFSYLWLGELYKNPTNAFGGDSDAALRANKWVVGGDSKLLSNGSINLVWTVGDTYYQRYDCLKTYAFTQEDPNQLVEILSFMCESRVNIDGRYDRNRGQLKNYLMSPTIFNLLNPIYSQLDNFFTSRKMDIDDEEKLVYPNQITYTKTKNSGADVDLWTNITLASGLELDGDKGQITSLKRFNDQLIAFQDTGISQILYNENTQIATAQGTPIEIANSGKVQGKRYLSDTIGCSNKWSICTTPSGIYFIDNHDKSIYLFNGQLQNLSVSGGMNTWCKQNLTNMEMWRPDYFNNFVSYYDKQNQEVLFINADTALAYSEKLGAFTSFYDYGKAPWFVNFEGEGLWATYYPTKNIPQGDVLQPATEIWQHHGGEYCSFFGKNKPYWMTLIGNPDPLLDKTFTNLEFRATVDGDAIEEEVQVTDSMGRPLYDGDNPIMRKTGRIIPYLPFDSLETWNEYQHGVAQLGWRNGHQAFMHHALNNDASLKRKFRIWRCDIPRDNYPIPDGSDEEAYNAFIKDETIKGISRFKKHPMDRMRNPWLYLKLMKKAEEEEGKTLGRAEIHDVLMTYFE